jgi:quercetin dioxygenase-like cupin family protein
MAIIIFNLTLEKPLSGRIWQVSRDSVNEGEAMKHSNSLIQTILLAATLPLAFGTNTAIGQDLAKVVPDDVKVLIENDRVRVLDVLHKPGAKEPMHSHPAYVAVFLSATKLKVTTPDGKTVERDRTAGEVSWSEAVTHAIENVGTADQHVIVIELKK